MTYIVAFFAAVGWLLVLTVALGIAAPSFMLPLLARARGAIERKVAELETARRSRGQR